MKKILLIVAAVSILASCKEQVKEKKGDNISLEWNEKGADKTSSIVQDIKYIPIETHPDGLFNGNSSIKLLLKNNKILIFDKRNANALLMFDMNGRFLRKIGNRGGGPGEYTMLWNFTADDKAIYLLDVSTNKILIYDYEGNHIQDKKLPIHAMDINLLDNGDFLLAEHPLTWRDDQDNYKIAVTDNKFVIKNRLLKSNESDSKLGMDSNFGDLKDYITYQSYVQDTLYVFDRKTGSYTTYSFDFPNKVPLEMRSGIDFAKGEHQYQYLAITPALITGKYISGIVSNKPFLLDTQSQKLYFNDENSLYGIRRAVYNGYVVSIFTGIQYKYVTEKGSWPRAPKEMDEFFMADDDNVGLILYKLKE